MKDTFGISNDFSLQYFKPKFQDYFTIRRSDQDQLKLCITLVILPVFGSPSDQLSTDYDSSSDPVVSSADSAATTSAQYKIILKRQKFTEHREPWPKLFPIPQSAYETEM